MNARDLIKTWPGLPEMKPQEILVHPAWKLLADLGDVEAALTVCNAQRNAAADTEYPKLQIAITLDDEPHTLTLFDCAAFADLHLLWTKLADLPEALVIALLEKEGGAWLQTVENVIRKELKIISVAVAAQPIPPKPNDYPFHLVSGTVAIDFALDLGGDTVSRLGLLDNLDVTHESLRSLTRTARAEYGVLDLDAESVAALKTGDFLLAGSSASTATWQVDLPNDDRLRLRDVAEESFSFAQFADDALPPVPAPNNIALFRQGREFARATLSNLGDVSGYRITEVF